MNRFKASVYVTFTVLLITSFVASSAAASTTETFTISGTTVQYTLNMPAGTTFNGSIAATGLIRVWVNDANGTVVANLGIIDQTATLTFTAYAPSSYTINLQNDLPNTVQVTLSYVTDPELQANGQSLLPVTYLPIFLVVTVIGVALILYFSHKNKKISR